MGASPAKPQIELMPLADADDAFASLIARVVHQEARIVVESGGVPVAALVSADDLARLVAIDDARDELFAVVDRMREALDGVSEAEIVDEAERSVADARARRRKRAAERTAQSA